MLSFRRMRESDLQNVLDWRVKPEITQFMLTEVAYDMAAQRRWFARVGSSPNEEYWIIEHETRPVGVLSLSAIDRANRHATWGLYLGEKINSPVGGLIPVYFYNDVFARQDLNLHKLYGMVLETNTSMLKMHRSCGYREVGVYKDHVLRDGEFLDVVVVELLRETWLAQGGRFAKHRASFEHPPSPTA